MAKIIPFPLERRRAEIARENPSVEVLNGGGFLGVRLRPPGIDATVVLGPGNNTFWVGNDLAPHRLDRW